MTKYTPDNWETYGTRIKAFVDYCTDTGLNLVECSLSAADVLDVSIEISGKASIEYEQEITEYLTGTPIPEISDIRIDRQSIANGQVFKREDMEYCFGSARKKQDQERITTNRTDNGYMRVVLPFARGVINEQGPATASVLTEERIDDIRLAVLADKEAMLGQKCPDELALWEYATGKIGVNSYVGMDIHLSHCDTCPREVDKIYHKEPERVAVVVMKDAVERAEKEEFEFFESQFEDNADN